MNILFLNYEFPPLGGGAGVCTRYEAEGLAKIGHRITVITTWFEGYPEIESSNNLQIIRLKSKRKYMYKSDPFEMLSWVDRTKKYLINSSFDFDVCFSNFIIPGGIVGNFVKKIYKIPHIIISHGQDIPFFFPSQMLKYHVVTFFWLRNIVKKSDRLVLLTEKIKHNADKFLGKTNRRKNIIIPNGCDHLNFQPDYSKKSKLFKIIFVGRLVGQKDPFTFLKALLLIESQIADYSVDIVGDGPLREKMEQYIATKQLRNKVCFCGWVEKRVILEKYQSANLQVMTSRDEAMSIAALESLYTGQYLISTPVSGNTEMIVDGVNGEFFNFGNHHQLANKICNFYQRKFKENYHVPETHLSRFREKYKWENIVLQYDKLINEVLNEYKNI